MVCVFLVWAGSSAWLGVMTLRTERPPYTRNPLIWGRRVGSSNLPRPTRTGFDYFLVFVFLFCITWTRRDLLRARFSYFGSFNFPSPPPGNRKGVNSPHPSSL